MINQKFRTLLKCKVLGIIKKKYSTSSGEQATKEGIFDPKQVLKK